MHGSRTARSPVLWSCLIAGAALVACTRTHEITSLTTISGLVNGSAVEGKVVAHIDTDRGGSSTCDFTQLPQGFNPGTFGTHA